MATTAKKRTASKSKKSVSKSQAPIRREVGAFVCYFLALLSLLGCFNVDALFINFFCALAKGLIGWGFYAMPVMLAIAGTILITHGGRPVRLRVWCCMLLPVSLGALIHLFAYKGTLSWELSMFVQLYQSGREMASGGLLSGFIAFGFQTIFSKVGAILIFLAASLFCLLMALNMTVISIIEAIRNRPKLEYEKTAEPVDTAAVLVEKVAEKKAKTAAKKKSVIDIPVDDPPFSEEKPKTQNSFFDNKPKVKTPDQLIAELAKHDAGEGTEEFGHFSQEEEDPIEEEPLKPLKNDKVKPEEAAIAAAQVAREVKTEVALRQYQYPPVSLLASRSGREVDGTEEMRVNAARLSDTIRSFGIEASITNVIRGPSITRYELELDKGIKLAKLTGLADDIALALGATGVRIAAIPDKISVVGIEVPNKLVSTVYLRDVIGSPVFQNHPSKAIFALGTDISGNNIIGDIAKLPHMLIAGTTGSGKSVCTNSLIISLLYKASPEEVRLILIDPKMVELGIYNGIPHLLIPVVTDPKKAAGALQWAVSEMMRRYKIMAEKNVRDVYAYNKAVENDPERQKLPQIVIVIDELADLMLVAAKEVEESVCRIAQMARAAGMHLIIATQRPSADVITGLMKANIPSRIAFAVASQLESRIILDTTGAEKLVGKGDMLFAPLGSGKPQRIQGCFITDGEIESVVGYVKRYSEAEYSDEIQQQIEMAAEKKQLGPAAAESDSQDDFDELLPAAVEVILETKQASVSMLQRRLKLGYSRAARIVDEMEEQGIVGPFEGSKPRQVLITREQWQEKQMRSSEILPVLNDMPALISEDDRI